MLHIKGLAQSAMHSVSARAAAVPTVIREHRPRTGLGGPTHSTLPLPHSLPLPSCGVGVVPNQVPEAVVTGAGRSLETLGSSGLLISQKEKLRPREKSDCPQTIREWNPAPLI